MRFACLTTVAPGDTLATKCAAIAEAGCAGIETLIFPDTPLETWQAEVRRATAEAGLEIAAVIVGGLALYQPEGVVWAREALQAIAEIGAPALITPEYRAQEPLPLFPPYPQPPTVEQAQVDAALDELVVLAAERDMPLLLEPLTQFESRFWHDVPTVAHVCQRLNNTDGGRWTVDDGQTSLPSTVHRPTRLALDTHNMNITEANIAATIHDVGLVIGHVHLADNNRQLPGEGHIDFASILAALRTVHYDGWYSFECAIIGDFVPKMRTTIEYLQRQGLGAACPKKTLHRLR